MTNHDDYITPIVALYKSGSSSGQTKIKMLKRLRETPLQAWLPLSAWFGGEPDEAACITAVLYACYPHVFIEERFHNVNFGDTMRYLHKQQYNSQTAISVQRAFLRLLKSSVMGVEGVYAEIHRCIRMLQQPNTPYSIGRPIYWEPYLLTQDLRALLLYGSDEQSEVTRRWGTSFFRSQTPTKIYAGGGEEDAATTN